MNKAIIIGHKNPDTDSVVASLVAEDYFKNILKINAKAARAGELNNETKFVLKKFKVAAPPLKKYLKDEESLILVDHNEKDQAIDGLNMSKVEVVIDHHKIVFETEKPILFKAEPVGSTSSILAKMYKEAGKKISKINAGLLLAGILSDTLNLTSPTTTDLDRKIVDELNKVARISLKIFAGDLFSAKSSLKGISLADITTKDYKLFVLGKHKLGIGVWETTNPDSIGSKKKEIIELLKKRKEKEGLDYMLFFVVDIIKQYSELYVVGEKEKELVEKVFKAKTIGDTILLKSIVSRKKQIVPPLTEELTK